jgi:hypothetical protein
MPAPGNVLPPEAVSARPCVRITQESLPWSNTLQRLAQGAASRRRALQAKTGGAGQRDRDHELAAQRALARQSETKAHGLARDVRTLVHWLSHDVLALAGQDLATRRELFDFIVAELAAREPEDARRLRPVRVALQNQRDDLLAFAGLLDAKLADIARAHAIAEPLVREACVLHGLPTTYWQGWNRLRAQLGAKFHALFDTVRRAMAETQQRVGGEPQRAAAQLLHPAPPSRWRIPGPLDLLRFFLNHRRFLRSRRDERQGKRPRELMTGQGHPHWLTLLGLGPLQPRRA